MRMGYTGTVMEDPAISRLDDELSAFAAGERDRFGDAERQRILLALLHLIAVGIPVAAADVATAAGVPTATVKATVADLPPAWFETLDDERLVGFGGLTQNPTRHRLDLGSRSLYAWCAFDCLFLPALLGRPLAVQSICPTTRDPVRLVA